MKLELAQKLQQQQILAPQMILSMDILLLPALNLEQRIQQEFAENPALEIVEPEIEEETGRSSQLDSQTEGTEQFERLDALQEAPLRTYEPERRRKVDDVDGKHEALQNTEGRPPGLKEALTQQLHLKNLRREIQDLAENIINNLDQRGFLLCSAEELRTSQETGCTPADFQAALDAVRSLDPPGIAAEDLRECLLLQLERDPQEYPLETEIIRNHLEDLAMNKIPKIARDLGTTVEKVKEALEIISSLDPIPGGHLEPHQAIYVRPDVVVEEIDGELRVRVENQTIPQLQVSKACQGLLRTAGDNRQVKDFLRKKIESAQWLIQAIQQRQRTLYDIARAIVEYQKEFLLNGTDHIRAMKMQTIADDVGVHISTISRAIKGKYMQTPQGLFEMRYFFTGGVSKANGEIESRRNIYRRISEIINKEDKSRPYSDTSIARILGEQGLSIARRTVTKYREQEGIPSSRLRKTY